MAINGSFYVKRFKALFSKVKNIDDIESALRKVLGTYKNKEVHILAETAARLRKEELSKPEVKVVEKMETGLREVKEEIDKLWTKVKEIEDAKSTDKIDVETPGGPDMEVPSGRAGTGRKKRGSV
jgi:hypothetical protein